MGGGRKRGEDGMGKGGKGMGGKLRKGGPGRGVEMV